MSEDAPTLLTVGYGARTIDEFLEVLKEASVEFLIDVRSAPYSKFKPEFSKETLKAWVESTGAQYLFLGDVLGGRPDDESCYVDGKVVYDLVAKSEGFRSGIARVIDGLDKGFTLCLMCSEGKPQECHRSKLIGEYLIERGVEVCHIDADGSLVSQAHVMERVPGGGQEDLFGQSVQTSRKRYLDEGKTP